MPIGLHQIVGHAQPLRLIRRSLAEDRLHHSMIFHGPEAVGKRTVALALAATLNCDARGEDACGACPSCSKISRSLHPDVRCITLEKTVIPIDSIRGLRQEAAFKPFEGRRRVFIVDPADRLSVDAQNALLKTLEEPTDASCLILITARLMSLLPTTRSRCQSLAFGTMPPESLARALSAARGWSEEDAGRAARLSGGRYGAALAIDLPEHDGKTERLLELLDRLAGDQPRDHVIEDAEEFGADAEEIAPKLALLGSLVRDMMVLSRGGRTGVLIHADRSDALATLADRFAGRLERMLDRVRLAVSDLERNVNRRLLVETLLFDLAAGGTGP